MRDAIEMGQKSYLLRSRSTLATILEAETFIASHNRNRKSSVGDRLLFSSWLM